MTAALAGRPIALSFKAAHAGRGDGRNAYPHMFDGMGGDSIPKSQPSSLLTPNPAHLGQSLRLRIELPLPFLVDPLHQD